jgi:putative FmdB family regulatory protein
MPIYAYRCAACGHSRDVLQKMSDAQLTVCPACGAEQFQKQVTAAGFQLKGSGWYATDFRNGSGKAASVPAVSGGESADKPAAAPAPTSDAPSAAPAANAAPAASPPPAACGGSCACH